MKTKNHLLYFLSFLAIALVPLSCGDDDESSSQSLLQTAENIDNLSLFVEAINQTELEQILSADAPITILAPNNNAFEALLDSNPSWNTLSDIDDTLLTDFLLYHLLGGITMSREFGTSNRSTRALGPNDVMLTLQIETDMNQEVIFNRSASIDTEDIEASNGVLHIIDDVLTPPSSLEIAQNFGSSLFISALSRADLNTDLLGLLSGAGPFTVFVPSDPAFQAFLDSRIDWNTIDDIPLGVLEPVLSYHIIDMVNLQSDQFVNGDSLLTLGGVTIDINLNSVFAIETSSDQVVDIVLSDIQSWNGVVHFTNQVLLP